ncbi:DMT family transporter [Xylophilus sp. GOD-11R]|uniref:DMT family transporter n=1 Tax=Xylophilus sp. GOD-11R TaxID=3089814 RepID=UPI00298C4376|nr:SMR family transporter [Xylophilus sp. GOD-11R]WPB57297.1 SMR family transporter [Xylophilus sp. GOD-11R]
MNIGIFFLALVSIFMSASAQIALKRGLSTERVIAALQHQNYGQFASFVLVSPWVISGLALYVLSMVCWIAVLTKTQVSVAYPMVGLGFVFTAVAGFFLFGEGVTVQKILGISLIIAGVYTLARSGS